MLQALAPRRPRQPHRLAVHGDDQLLRHHAVEEGDDPRLAFHAAVGEEARGDALVDVGDVAERLPDVGRARRDRDFLMNAGHDLQTTWTVSYTHLRAHETPEHLVCRLLLE